jgi:hypothetical protein
MHVWYSWNLFKSSHTIAQSNLFLLCFFDERLAAAAGRTREWSPSAKSAG